MHSRDPVPGPGTQPRSTWMILPTVYRKHRSTGYPYDTWYRIIHTYKRIHFFFCLQLQESTTIPEECSRHFYKHDIWHNHAIIGVYKTFSISFSFLLPFLSCLPLALNCMSPVILLTFGFPAHHHFIFEIFTHRSQTTSVLCITPHI